MYTLAKSQDFEQYLLRHIIKSSPFTVPVARFAMQQAERAVSRDARFRQENVLDVIVKEELTLQSPLTGTPQILKYV